MLSHILRLNVNTIIGFFPALIVKIAGFILFRRCAGWLPLTLVSEA